MALKTDDPIDLEFVDKAYLWVDLVFGGKHRVRKFVREANYFLCLPHGTLATFDDDKLTRIVIASHLIGLRAEVSNHGLAGLKIMLHDRRSRVGRLFHRHPGRTDLLTDIDEYSDWVSVFLETLERDNNNGE